MQDELHEAMEEARAFSWLTTGLVCLEWQTYFANRGWYGRGRNCV
jgi:hypothetical protein